MVAFRNHTEEGGDIATAPVGVAYRRFDLGDVEELIDECEQSVALSLNNFCLFSNLCGRICTLLEIVA